MKHVTFIALVVAGASVIGAGAAVAKGHGGFGPRASFEEMDANGDGEVTQAEMEELRTRHFLEADADGDGTLTLEELQAKAAQKASERAAKMLAKLDKNGDGALSADELPKPRNAEKHFSRLDADNSGGISKEEFEAMRDKHRGGPDKGKHKWKDKPRDEN